VKGANPKTQRAGKRFEHANRPRDKELPIPDEELKITYGELNALPHVCETYMGKKHLGDNWSKGKKARERGEPWRQGGQKGLAEQGELCSKNQNTEIIPEITLLHDALVRSETLEKEAKALKRDRQKPTLPLSRLYLEREGSLKVRKKNTEVGTARRHKGNLTFSFRKWRGTEIKI